MTVVNPLTGTVYPAGTQIPIAQLNPFAAAALSRPAAGHGSRHWPVEQSMEERCC